MVNKILFSASVITILFSCNTQEAKKKVAMSFQADTLINTQNADNVTILYSDSGKLKAKIFAPKLIGNKVNGEEIVNMPKGVKAQFYNQYGQVDSYLTAEKGKTNQSTKIIEVWQNVEVRNVMNEKLNTEHLYWNQITKKIYTDKFVRITTEKEALIGTGMEAEQDFTKWKIKNPEGIISINKE